MVAISSGRSAAVYSHQYEAGSDVSTGSTTSTSMVDVDATNAAITFTVGPQGKAIIEVSALCGQATLNKYTRLGLREGTNDLAGSDMRVFYATVAATFIRVYYMHTVSGLTPGASVTYKLALATDSAGTAYVQTGPTNGPLVMKVTSY